MLRLNLGQPRYDADGDGGGAGEATKALAVEMAKVIKTNSDLVAKVDTLANDLVEAKADTEKSARKTAEQAVLTEQLLAVRHGKKGAQDVLMDFSKFIAGAYRAKNGLTIPDDWTIDGQKVKALVEKALVDFTTTTDATAGFLVPDILMPEIRELKDIYGTFIGQVTEITAPAGVSVKFNADAARPVAAFRAQQGALIPEESTPMSFAQDSVVSELLGTHITIANEMLNAPGGNFSAVSTVRLMHAIVTNAEFGMIAGTTGAGYPSDGILADATAQTTLATMTFANLVTFLQECLADNEYSFNTQANKIFMTPGDLLALAGESLAGALVWGKPEEGIPTRLLGYEMVTHPSFNNGSAKHVVLGDPKSISLVNDGKFSIDISPHAGTSFVDNSSILRAFNHYDWNLGHVTEWHKAVITA